jgi:hypothetical protein
MLRKRTFAEPAQSKIQVPTYLDSYVVFEQQAQISMKEVLRRFLLQSVLGMGYVNCTLTKQNVTERPS